MALERLIVSPDFAKLLAALFVFIGSDCALGAGFAQPYPCSIEVSGNSMDCKSFGLGEMVNGCIKVDGVISNETADDVQDFVVTILVDKHVVTNLKATSLTGPAKPSTKSPFTGASKFELSQALMLNSHIYMDRPETECLLNPVR